MITAVDTNVLLDVLSTRSQFKKQSREDLDASLADGALVISEPVYAELASGMGDAAVFYQFLAETGITLDSSQSPSLHRAGVAWHLYQTRRAGGLACGLCGARITVQCERCGVPIRSRQHLIADFIIGAHAALQADRLLTRDRGMFTMYFPELVIVGGQIP